MSGLFDIFDPWVGGLPLNWLSIWGGLLLLPGSYWVCKSEWSWVISQGLSWITGELKNYLQSSHLLCFVSLFVFILVNNVMGTLPYVFTASTQIPFSAPTVIVFWVLMSGSSLYANPVLNLAHMIPPGTPPVLQPFMVLIEFISSNVRPLSLVVRIVANMTTGHLLLSLAGTALSHSSLLAGLGVAQMTGAVLQLEMAVAVIQAYVFTMLTTLSLSELYVYELKLPLK